MFNWLQGHCAGARVLDLFAGSGALGLEALSRGAAAAVLVERHPAAVAQLRASVAALGAEARVVAGDRTAGEALAKAKWNDIGAFMEATLALRKPLPLIRDEWLLIALSPDRMLAGDRLEIHVADKQAPPASRRPRSRTGCVRPPARRASRSAS